MLCPRCGNDHGTPSELDYLHDGHRMVEVVAVAEKGTSALLRDCVTEEEFSLGTCLLARSWVPVREPVVV